MTPIRLPAFEPRPYQLPFLEARDNGCKRCVLVWHRRAGKEICCFNDMIKHAYYHRVGTYVYFFPTARLGRRILWDGMDKTGKRFLDYIPKSIIEGQPNSVEMKIKLTNGSSIQVMGTDQIINVGVNPIGCVFSEFSLQDPHSWNFTRPILRENGGWAVFNFCVAKDTLVLTEEGLKRICKVSRSKKEFSDLNSMIYGINGFNEATEFYNGGIKKLLRFSTKKGYEIACTPNHPLWNGNKWIKAQEWKVGDNMPIQLDQQVFSNKSLDISTWERPKPKDHRGKWKYLGEDFLTLDFFYIMGLYLAEGSMFKHTLARGSRLTITNTEEDIIVFLNRWGFTTLKDGIHHVYCGTEIQSFFSWFGLDGTAKTKDIPEKLLACKREEIVAFLQGYFDGDGTTGKTKYGYIKATSASKKLLQTLQVLLLNFGIVSRLSMSLTPPTKKVKCESTVYNLEIEGHFAWRFFERIGFRLKRKQERSDLILPKIKKSRGDMVPTNCDLIGWYPKAILRNPSMIGYRKLAQLNAIRKNDYIEKLLEDGYFWDPIVGIEPHEDEVFDFVIPETHSFFSNGFLSHNTPRGKNHAYDLYLMAKNNPEWYCQKLTIEDTAVLSADDIEKERQEGMSDVLIAQEFYCSFDQGAEGAYYAKLLNQAEIQGRLTHVPYDPLMSVDTYWDLGVGDETVILFAQNIGKEIHLIDMYRNQGEGLNHYAKVLQDKAHEYKWKYGDHYAPHDIRVRELGSGAQTRLDIARDLGINFEIVPNLSIAEGIELCRGIFPRLWIDSDKCNFFIKGAENYHKHYNEKLNVYSDRPVHDWSSHVMDSFRMLAIMQNKKRGGSMSEEDADKMENLYRKRIYS